MNRTIDKFVGVMDRQVDAKLRAILSFDLELSLFGWFQLRTGVMERLATGFHGDLPSAVRYRDPERMINGG